jgi:hypothetical protein
LRTCIVAVCLAAACAPDVRAVYDPERAVHAFDVPFPSDTERTPAGTPDLGAFPRPPSDLASGIADGWASQIETTSHGFGNLTAAYLRLDGEVSLPTTTAGATDDPVVWVAIDGSEQLPLDLRFVADPAGDPHWGPNTLAAAPQLGHPPRSGQTYVVALMRAAGVGAPEGWTPTDAQRDALRAAGIRGDIAMATTFTVQDGTGELRALFADADTRLDFGEVVFRRVVSLEYAAGTTPSGDDATLEIARFEDGTERTVYLSLDPGEVQTVDLMDGWPMAVYEADIQTLNYQDPDDRPYMSPGLLHVTDVGRDSGWIEVTADGVTATPWLEPMRVTVQLPKGPTGEPVQDAHVMIWDHGTGGDAYNAVQRPNAADDSRAFAQAFADAGWAVLGRDATLYGSRYPLVDEGFTDGSLGFYNIVNLPAFRDNQRQTAIDGHVLLRYAQQQLNLDLPAGSVDASRVRRGGHSLGSVTSNLGLAAEPEAYEGAFLFGTGGCFSLYFLETGLLADQDPALIAGLFSLFGAAEPAVVDTQSLIGAAIGVPEPAWGAIDRLHPLFTLFQTTMDPSDPMALARDETVAARVVIAPGDKQTPDFTAEALARALPDATVVYCQPSADDYDPHQCLWREPEGADIVADWLATP